MLRGCACLPMHARNSVSGQCWSVLSSPVEMIAVCLIVQHWINRWDSQVRTPLVRGNVTAP